MLLVMDGLIPSGSSQDNTIVKDKITITSLIFLASTLKLQITYIDPIPTGYYTKSVFENRHRLFYKPAQRNAPRIPLIPSS